MSTEQLTTIEMNTAVVLMGEPINPITTYFLDLFEVEGQKGSEALTYSQQLIFQNIISKRHNRLCIITPTQFGKSLTVALACIILACFGHEIVAVVAPTKDKAKIIMRYFIDHLSDNIIFYEKLEANTRLERLQKEESKQRIVLRTGGGIYALSTNERNFGKAIESAMGEGASSVIMDEACLIRDDTEATIYRMIAGKGADAFYCKIGNPFYSLPPNSHFFQSSIDYPLIYIDYHKAIEEGRLTPEFIQEAKKKPLFDILFECKFPPRDQIDSQGFRYLFSKEEIEEAFVDELPELTKDEDGEDLPEDDMPRKICGADIGRGRDSNAFVNLQADYAWLHEENVCKDTMQNVNTIKDNGADMTNIDDTGVGGGVTDRCTEKGLPVQGISWAESAIDKMRFANKKAENFWAVKEFLADGGKLVKNKGWYELLEIKYKINSSEKIQIEPKDHLIKRGVKSPNIADGLALCFNPTIEPDINFF